MISKAVVALLVLALAACGGGSDTAVSPSPPASGPAPGPAPVPVPAPEPAPTPPPAPAATVPGAIVAKALCTSTQPVHGIPYYVAAPPDGIGTRAIVWQQCAPPESPAGGLYHVHSGGYSGPSLASVVILTPLESLAGPFRLGTSLMAEVVVTGPPTGERHTLHAPAPLAIADDAAVPLGAVLQRWESQAAAGEPWFVELQALPAVSGEQHPVPLFKLCWEARLPGVVRTACQLHRQLDGAPVGLEVTDDPATGSTTLAGWREGVRSDEVAGAAIARALCKDTRPVHGAPLLVGFLPGGVAPTVFVAQSCGPDPTSGGARYDFQSGGYSGEPAVPLAAVATGLLSATAPFSLASTLEITVAGAGSPATTQSVRSAEALALADVAAIPFGSILQRWTNGQPAAEVALQVRKAPEGGPAEPLFSLCWDLALPGMTRLSCHVHRRDDSEAVGLEVVETDAAGTVRRWIGWR